MICMETKSGFTAIATDTIANIACNAHKQKSELPDTC